MAGVRLQGVRKAYGPLTVADGIDLVIQPGELVCLLGPSGCGKTTTLRLVAGFVAPDAGTIHVGDRQLSGPGFALPPEKRDMSMIFQSYALWPHMTVAENVAYGLSLRKLPKADIARKVDAMLATTQLQKLAARYPGELSGGQQQRVALARALVVEPQTLLLDEPLSNLDTNLREEMRFEIRRLHDAFRYTTIYVTHDQLEAMTTADRIVVMNAGRMEQVGSPEDIYQRPESEFVARFIGGTNILRGRRDGRVAHVGALAVGWELGEAGAGDQAVLSIRPHEVVMGAAEGPNVFPGTVMRHTYLGAQRDYLVDVAGTTLRVLAPLDVRAEPGDAVQVQLPPGRVRALAR